jgi:hypothetical protein
MFLAYNKRFNIFHVITYFELQSKVNIFQAILRQIGLPQMKIVGIIILQLVLVQVAPGTALEECGEAFGNAHIATQDCLNKHSDLLAKK